jgi:[histone H3]-lysine36 N-trimethyltransferase
MPGAKCPRLWTSSPETTPSTVMDTQSDPYVKLEDNVSPSQSPTLVMDIPTQNFKPSPSPTPTSTTDAAESKSTSPPLAARPKTSRKAAQIPVQLIGNLPIARQAAVSSFTEIYCNNYQYKSLGRSREVLESMTCHCTYEHGSSFFPLRFESFSCRIQSWLWEAGH